MNQGFQTEEARDMADSNSADTPPPYGSKAYWETRYRQFYSQCQKVTPPNSLSTEEQSVETAVGNNGKGMVQSGKIIKNSVDSNNGFVSHLHDLEGDDPLPGHEWYFSYEELRPLLFQELVEKLVDLIPKDERSVSLLEIGCGDAPIIPNLAKDIYIQTGIATKAIASDYSAAVIDYLKDPQQQTQGCSSRTAWKESTEANLCGTENHDQQTTDTRTVAPLDPSWTNSRPRKRHKAQDKTLDVMIHYCVEDATKLSYEDNQFHIVLEKGMLDASLADSESGMSRCHSILGEAARVVRMNGAFVLVSHVNAHTTHGEKWLEDVLLPGLFQSCSDCAWSIDVHGNSTPDEDEDQSHSHSESEDDEDNNTMEEVDEGVDNRSPVEETNLGPAVYILWKRPLCKDSKLSSTMGDEDSSIDYKYKDFLDHIEIQFFSYET